MAVDDCRMRWTVTASGEEPLFLEMTTTAEAFKYLNQIVLTCLQHSIRKCCQCACVLVLVDLFSFNNYEDIHA